MSKRKICVVITARTSYTKIKPILTAIKAHKALDLQVVCSASAVLDRFGSTDAMVERDGFNVNERIYNLLEGETLQTCAKSTGFGVIELSGTFARLKPDIVVVMADRFEVMATAIAASYQNIPLAHVQGGEVSGNIDEKVRHAVTKLADIHFPASNQAADYIERMGENPDMIFKVGCPSTDLAQEVLDNPALEFDVYDRYGGVGTFPDLSKGYYIVLQHAVTTEHQEAREQTTHTLEAMNRVGERTGKPVLWFWPNVDAGADGVSKAIRVFRENKNPQYMQFIKNMAPQDFLRVLNKSEGIIGNSSTGIREASFLGVPAVNIGVRQNARERGPNVIDVDYNVDDIYEAIQSHCTGKKPPSDLYGQGNAGQQIAEVLSTVALSYSKVLHYTQTS